MDKLIVTTLGIALIAGIYWFFFGKEKKETPVSDDITIIVDGGYKPESITIPKDKPVKITFIRKDENSCLEDIFFPDYKIKTYLPLNTPITLTLPPPHTGTSGFHCGMNMFQGRINGI